MNARRVMSGLALLGLLISVAVSAPRSDEVSEEFRGKIAKSYEDSQEWWPKPVEAPEGAPNILIVLLDDVGFAHIGSYGGLIETPNIDALAAGGLRYNNFHTTALCSPSRASLMAGRNPHSIGLGSHALTAMGFPGYNAMIPKSAQSVAKVLQGNGYTNYALGKWDHTPLYEVSVAGPFDHWPTREGFDHYYGFMAADAHNFFPVMWSDHAPIEPWEGRPNYHLSTDMADKAIEFMTAHKSIYPERPLMMFWAPGAMHSPHHAPRQFIEKYRGRFDMGWDEARQLIITRQKQLGVIPIDADLTERPRDIPAWNELSAEERMLFARQMEAFAGQMEHVDHEVGRIVECLRRIGQLDNTLILVTSDNGASGEGGLSGSFNETYILNGLQTPFDANMQHYAQWGGPTTYPHFHAGWAMAGNTPFKYFKQIVHRGGIQDPLIVHWPNGIEGQGEIRSQYHHIIDVAPTLLEVAGLKPPEQIDGVPQTPYDGVSFAYTFNDPEASNRKRIQYYEMFGNRAIWADGWKAVTIHGHRMPWDINVVIPFDEDVWELYHVDEDFSEAHNLAAEHPEKLEELKKLFDEQAWKYNVYPLYDDMIMRLARQQDRLFGDRKVFTYFAPGAVRIAEKASAPVKNRSHSITTELELTGGEEGVIVACGGFTGGYTMFIKDNKLYFDYNYYNGVYYTLESPPLPAGPVELKFHFTKTGEYQGTGELFVDGEKVDEVDMPAMHVSTFSLSETFDVGQDTGTPVSTLYEGHFPFQGGLDKVVIELE
ncbi:MAG TPA: arylsulfatase [Thermoguttaceae bacterium]|nr:arylsulfatase [Thermoguttaceae bacterium]